MTEETHKLQLIVDCFDLSKEQYADTIQSRPEKYKHLTTEQIFALILVDNLLRFCPISTMLELFDESLENGAVIAKAIHAREYMSLEMQCRAIPDEYAFYLILKRYIDLYLALQSADPTFIKLLELRAVLEDQAEKKFFHPPDKRL